MRTLLCMLLVIGGGVGSAGCKEFNPAYCAMHADDTRCGIAARDAAEDAAPVVDARGPCTDNTGCPLATAPVCDLSGGDGVCVTCTATEYALCTDATPVCGASHSCEACRVNADCPLSDLCLPTGACAAEADIAYVAAGATDNTTCSKAMPCLKIMAGLVAVNGSGQPRPYLKVTGSLDEAVTINRNVTIMAEPGAQLTRSTNGPILLVTAESIVEIDDLMISNSHGLPDPGISTTGTTSLTLKRVTVSGNKANGISFGGLALTVSGSTIANNGLIGVECTKGSVSVTQSKLSGNARGGLVIAGSTFDVVNNFIHHNGDSSNSLVGGVSLAPTSGPNRFEFNTVVDNQIKPTSVLAAGVVCDVPGFTGPNNIIARNTVGDSAVVSNANTVGACAYPTSTIAATIETLAFVAPDSDPRDYHLRAGSSAAGAATTPTIVDVDVDGDARPQQGTNDQGADELEPPS